MVKGNTLADISDQLNLHEFIRTGADLKELTGKRMRSVRADVLEALIASIYLDGGLDAAAAFIQRFWGERMNAAEAARRDSKTELQEWAHANRLGTPKYRERERSGPDHDPLFTVTVEVTGKGEASGTGSSKRIAEQAAARAPCLLREGVWQAEEETRHLNESAKADTLWLRRADRRAQCRQVDADEPARRAPRSRSSRTRCRRRAPSFAAS